MNRAFSLPEVMVGLLIGLISIGALLSITRSQVSRHLESRVVFRAQSSLNLAGEELDAMRISRDPEFWKEFPLNPVAGHPGVVGASALSFHAECPDEFSSGCFTYYDIVPSKHVHSETVIYKATVHDLPLSISLSPKDATSPPGLGPEIEEMSVLLVTNGSWTCCFLVEDKLEESVSLLSIEQQPWFNPETDYQGLQAANIEVTCLGQIEITHVGLKPVKGSGQRLTYRPYVFKEGQWTKKRSRSSYQNLFLMEFATDPVFGNQLSLFDERAEKCREGVSHVVIQ